jgi:Rieske Fe-S protein
MNQFCEETEKKCNGRREFLVSASAIAGGLVLSLANVKEVSAESESKTHGAEVVIKLDEKSTLNTVGGSQVVETPSGKVVIVKTGDASFSAVSAICTHKGGTVAYDGKLKLFVCPNHGSKFGSDGANAGGPAKTPLKSFKPQSAIVLSGE